MGSIIKVNEYKDFNNNDILTSDGSGNVTINAAAMKNTPAFYAYKTSTQSIANTTGTQVTFDSEIFDTDGTFSSDRFTPAVAGKYYIYAQINMAAVDGKYFETRIHKNGSLYSYTQTHMGTVTYNAGSYIGQVIDSDDDDYFEIFTYQNTGGSINVAGDNKNTYFGAYRIIGG